jgi:DNA-binding transcriptional regulator YhcF (GntR family)
MNFNFTDSVRRALNAARDEAIRLEHDYVGTEHMLLGLLAVPENRATAVLEDLSVDLSRLRAGVEKAARPGKGRLLRGELPYTSRAKKVLEYSMAEARERKDVSVDTEHLLLALLREEKGIAAEVLGKFGVSRDVVRESLAKPWHVGKALAVMPEGRRSSFRVQIDDAADRSIYEQIIAQVTEAVATGDLKPGERLPTVRQLAEDADIAPGTVARAYSELEARGIVVTEGARGTRVAQRGDPVAAADRPAMLAGLLRPVAVAAFHLGANAQELRSALEEAMRDIYDKQDDAA